MDYIIMDIDRYASNPGHSNSSISNNPSTGAADEGRYPKANAEMNVKTYINDYPDAIIRTDVTSEDLIWSKNIANGWQGPRGNLGLARATSPSIRFGGEEIQYISDTESEHSCSSADTMILLNNEQNNTQILDTCIPPRPRTYQPISSVTGQARIQQQRSENRQTGWQHDTESGYKQMVGLRGQQLTCQSAINSRQLSEVASNHPGADNHSDDGYESNDTNMSFETGSSGSLSSKDSGGVEAPKSILKRSGNSSSKLTQRSVRFATDGTTDRQLETRTYGVRSGYVPRKATEDFVQPVVAVKKKIDKKTPAARDDTPSLEDRLRDLMVQDISPESNRGSNSETNPHSHNNGVIHGTGTPTLDYSDSATAYHEPEIGSSHPRNQIGVYRAVPILSTIHEQHTSVDREEKVIVVPPSPNYRVETQRISQNHTSRSPVMDNYISTDQVKNILSRQSSLRSTRSGTPTLISRDSHKMAHHSSLTNLPSEHANLQDSWTHHFSSMPQLPREREDISQKMSAGAASRLQNSGPNKGANGYTPASSSGSIPGEAPPLSHDLSPEISPQPRQRHSCYATYAELTDMYRNMAAGGRNKRWSNSSDLSMGGASSLRPTEGSKSKMVYGTTADLYRMMKDQIRQPKAVVNYTHNCNSVT